MSPTDEQAIPAEEEPKPNLHVPAATVYVRVKSDRLDDRMDLMREVTIYADDDEETIERKISGAFAPLREARAALAELVERS